MRVGMIGLGKLGLPAAEAMACRYETVGYDIVPVKSQSITITKDLDTLVSNSDIIFIAAQTPHASEYDGSQPSSHLPNRDFDYSYVCSILDQLEQLVDSTKMVVLISTVLPGTTRRVLAPRLTKAKLLYNPYLIAMGTVAHDMVNPEMVMIGTETGAADDAQLLDLKSFYAPLMENAPRIITGTWEEMESTKIFYNTFISAKLSLVNMIQDVAERIGHMDAGIVARALAESTHRIMGPAYMKPGMGDGGPCHPRDNIALRWLADDINLGYDLFDSIMQAREVQAANLAEAMCRHNLPVVIMGKSFKPGVPYTDGSYSLLVAHYVEQNRKTVTYDVVLAEPAVYLLAHDVDQRVDPAENSIIYDPWRRHPAVDGSQVILYGNTRDRVATA
jgi:UDPglucose 6-dehydrogenase